MQQYIESIISSLPEDDRSAVLSLDLDTDFICVILDVSVYKKGCELLIFPSVFSNDPEGITFYMSGDDIAAMTSHSLKEALHGFATDKGIPDSLFNEIYAFLLTKSPLNVPLTIPGLIEIVKKQTYKLLGLCKKSAENEARLIQDWESFFKTIERIQKEGPPAHWGVTDASDNSEVIK